MNAEEFHSLGRQLHDVTEHIEIRTNPGPPGADRDMTFDEKRKLSVYIASLDGDKLEKVLEIIMQEEPDLPGMPSCHSTSHHQAYPCLERTPHFCRKAQSVFGFACYKMQKGSQLSKE